MGFGGFFGRGLGRWVCDVRFALLGCRLVGWEGAWEADTNSSAWSRMGLLCIDVVAFFLEPDAPVRGLQFGHKGVVGSLLREGVLFVR